MCKPIGVFVIDLTLLIDGLDIHNWSGYGKKVLALYSQTNHRSHLKCLLTSTFSYSVLVDSVVEE